MVGKTEKTLLSENVPYEIGVCKFNELPKGVMQGMKRKEISRREIDFEFHFFYFLL